MILRRFTKDDFAEYRSWYANGELDRHLGPAPDQTWLDHVLSEVDGAQLSFLRDEELVAVVGVNFSNSSNPFYTITDLAVKPSLRGQGIGSDALTPTLKFFALETGESWQAFVDARNPGAKTFFEKLGWYGKEQVPDEHGMFRLALATPSGPNQHV
jgi:GNAT superfamily N-acetyltransferase